MVQTSLMNSPVDNESSIYVPWVSYFFVACKYRVFLKKQILDTSVWVRLVQTWTDFVKTSDKYCGETGTRYHPKNGLKASWTMLFFFFFLFCQFWSFFKVPQRLWCTHSVVHSTSTCVQPITQGHFRNPTFEKYWKPSQKIVF